MLFRTKKFLWKSFFLVLCVALGGYGIFWVRTSIRESRDNMDRAQAQEEVLTEKMQQRSELAKKHAFVNEKEMVLRDVFLDNDDVVETIEQLENLAQNSGISVEMTILDDGSSRVISKSSGKKDTDSKKKNEKKDKVTFLIKTRGTYEKTFAYLELVEKMRPVISFEEIVMKRDKEKSLQSTEESPEVSNKDVLAEFTVTFSKFSEE